MELRATSFRIGALALGAMGATATALVFSVSLIAILCGISFGAGGWLVDYFTGFRKLGGQLSAWALAAGGAIVLFSMRSDIEIKTTGLGYYSVPLQYVSVVLIWWDFLCSSCRRVIMSPNDTINTDSKHARAFRAHVFAASYRGR